ncbi:MAG: PEP-CTERM sorting domain-containing protein, partial [Proteobacteria bacterium]|nr:PEP-CTERM sorting domain-containing protein [Pseudomonadota bacterium]
VTGHLWTTGVGAVTGVVVALTAAGTTTGFANTATLAGYDNRTPDHQGTLLLVTPFRVLTNAAGNLPGFGTQLLNFVPEPGTLLLIGSGIAGLAIVGRSKMRK